MSAFGSFKFGNSIESQVIALHSDFGLYGGLHSGLCSGPHSGSVSVVVLATPWFGLRSDSVCTTVRSRPYFGSNNGSPQWFGFFSGSLPALIHFKVFRSPQRFATRSNSVENPQCTGAEVLCTRSRQQDVTQFCDAKLTRWALIHKAHRSPNATACVKKF